MDTDLKPADIEYLSEVDSSFNKLTYSVLHLIPEGVPISILRLIYNQGRMDEASSLIAKFKYNGQAH